MTMETTPHKRPVNMFSAALLFVAVTILIVGFIGLSKDTAPVWTLLFPTAAGFAAICTLRE